MTTNDKTHDTEQLELGEFVQVTSAHGNNGLAVILGAIPGEGQQPTLYRLGRIRPRRGLLARWPRVEPMQHEVSAAYVQRVPLAGWEV